MPDDLDALHQYYERRYSYHQGGDPESGLGAHIQKLRRALDFPKVDREFQMIEDEHSVPVVVIRDERDREQIEEAVARLTDPFRPCGPEVLRSLAGTPCTARGPCSPSPPSSSWPWPFPVEPPAGRSGSNPSGARAPRAGIARTYVLRSRIETIAYVCEPVGYVPVCRAETSMKQ